MRQGSLPNDRNEWENRFYRNVRSVFFMHACVQRAHVFMECISPDLSGDGKDLATASYLIKCNLKVKLGEKLTKLDYILKNNPEKSMYKRGK